MGFRSILFDGVDAGPHEATTEARAFFTDPRLDQIIESITAAKPEYDLKPFFYTPLTNVDAIRYRQEIGQDLEDDWLLERINSFSEKMSAASRCLALVDTLNFTSHQEGWFLEATKSYCEAVTGLAHDLTLANLHSRGLAAFREYVSHYVDSEGFQTLWLETRNLQTDLAGVKYCLMIRGNMVKVFKYEAETDYSLDVEKAFEKFKDSAARNYYNYKGNPEDDDMDFVEAQILDCVARLYPDVFYRLDQYCVRYSRFMDETIRVFTQEIQFYVAYQEYIADLKRSGLKFCYPRISDTKEVYDFEGFDLALAFSLNAKDMPVVSNDFYLNGPERILVVSGPNQGGKTTFARTFGQIHYLARLGCSVPGSEARLFLYDQLFTHFENEESIENLRGKLEDDLVRIYGILNQATTNSIVILNEIFTSTTFKDAAFLCRRILETIVNLDLLCVFVTFVDELASFNEKTVSMVSTVAPENPALRTYKILREPAGGLTYAILLAEKYRLTESQLMERIKS